MVSILNGEGIRRACTVLSSCWLPYLFRSFCKATPRNLTKNGKSKEEKGKRIKGTGLGGVLDEPKPQSVVPEINGEPEPVRRL